MGRTWSDTLDRIADAAMHPVGAATLVLLLLIGLQAAGVEVRRADGGRTCRAAPTSLAR